MALADFSDLVALGAIPDQTSSYDRYGVRATRLLELASAQVCAYLKTTEAELLAAITVEQATSLAAIVAECAASRLNRSLAPSSDASYGTGYESVLLNNWHKKQINELIGRPGGSSMSIPVVRDPDSSAITSPTVSGMLDDTDWYRNPDGTWSQPDIYDGTSWQ